MSSTHEIHAERDRESRAALVGTEDTSYKPHGDVDVTELPNNSHGALPGTLSWGSSNGSMKDETDFTAQPSQRRSLTCKAAASLSKTGTWTFEFVGLFFGAAAIAGIAGVLAYFDGRAIPDWPLNITLSALIALLATIANANLAAPIQSSLSQLKWIRFKTARAPLADMETYDEASRGTWGAIKLLVTLRGGFFGSFGAVLSIVALAIGPFSQQIASYRSHVTTSIEGASVPRALNYTGALHGRSSSNGFVPILPMKSAVYNGLFAENGNPDGALPVTCSTGNCTFDPFETLAMCYSCTDMTSLMTRYCETGTPADGNTSACGWQLPGGRAYLNKSSDVFSMTPYFPSAYGDMPYTTIMQLIFMGTESQAVANVLNPWALQCSLSACIQTMNTTVTNGQLTENVLGNFTNGTVVDINGANKSAPVSLTSPSTNETFIISMEAKLAMVSWFSTIFQTGSASRSVEATTQTISDGNVIVNLTVGVSSGETFFDTDVVTAFYWNYYEYPGGIQLLMRDLAISMTVAMRSFMGVAPHAGLAHSWESFVYVRWAFITLPIVVVVLTALFLGLTVWRTQRTGTRLWKSSALAVLLHGLDSDTRERIGGGGSLNDKKKRAEKLRVQLDDSSEVGSMLRA